MSNTLCMYMRDDRALRIMRMLPLQDVHSLILEGGSVHLSDDSLSTFPCVENLHICPSNKRRAFADVLLFLVTRQSSPMLLPKLRKLSAPDFQLSSALDTFAPGGLSGNAKHRHTATALAREPSVTGISDPIAFYLYIREEIDLVREGKIGETSCAGIPEWRVLSAIDRLEAVKHVQIVREDFNFFAK